MMVEKTLAIPVARKPLAADLKITAGAAGLVLFIHGTGSGRKSPRNRSVAEHLNGRGMATVLLDLLTDEEKAEELRRGGPQVDMAEINRRVIMTVDWLMRNEETGQMHLGLYGASTGAAAALAAAAERPQAIGAVVLRGGRPDLVYDILPAVKAPTLFIAGERDGVVLAVSRAATGKMTARTALEIVPAASHLFEEPGAIERVAEATSAWFEKNLT